MQLIYRTSMPKCDFNKVALQLHWDHTLAWVFFCKCVSYFQNNFLLEHLMMGYFWTYLTIFFETVFSEMLRAIKKSWVLWQIFITTLQTVKHRGVVVITAAQLHSTKSELRFCAGSNPARGVSEIRNGEDLWQWSRLEIRLNAFPRSTIPQKQFISIIIKPFLSNIISFFISNLDMTAYARVKKMVERFCTVIPKSDLTWLHNKGSAILFY